MTAKQRRHASLVFLALLFTDATEEEAEKAVREFEKKERGKDGRLSIPLRLGQ
jgi:hypothetical protein